MKVTVIHVINTIMFGDELSYRKSTRVTNKENDADEIVELQVPHSNKELKLCPEEQNC